MALLDKIADLSHKYQDTYIFLQKKEEIPLLFLYKLAEWQDLARTKILLRGYTHTENGWSMLTAPLADYNILASIPPAGVYNTKEGVVFFTKFPRRQWKVGISPDNCSVCVPNPYLKDFYIRALALGGKDTTRDNRVYLGEFTPSFLKELMSPRYMSIYKGINDIEEGVRLSSAISGNMFVSATQHTDNVCMFYNKFFIGEIKNNSLHMNYSLKTLVEEVSGYIPVEII